MIKKIFFSVALMMSIFLFSQNVTLTKAVKISDNNDLFFYLIDDKEKESSLYLGEIEVQGFSSDDAFIFNQVYKKAKTIGANSFSLKKIENIEGGMLNFNPNHYYINLYYTSDFPKNNNQVTIFSSAGKSLNFKINNETKTLEPRSYYQYQLMEGENSIGTGKFLGSKIKLSYKAQQPEQFFQILSAGIRPNHYGTGTLDLKLGDIIALEKSYAHFLKMIYSKTLRD